MIFGEEYCIQNNVKKRLALLMRWSLYQLNTCPYKHKNIYTDLSYIAGIKAIIALQSALCLGENVRHRYGACVMHYYHLAQILLLRRLCMPEESISE